MNIFSVKLKFKSSAIDFIGLLIIDLYFSLKLLLTKTDNSDYVCGENNISLFLFKVAKYKKLKCILDVSNIHIVEKYNIIKKQKFSASYFDKIRINRGLAEYRIADQITVLSSRVKETFKNNSPNIMNKVNTIFSGIDTNHFNNNYYEKKKYDICIVGSLSIYKNLNALLEILSYIDISLNIIFIGNYDNTISSIKKFQKLNHNFIHLNYIQKNDLLKLYNNSKILCITSLIEGMPKVVLEAGSCGLPVIGFKGSSIDDIINNGYNGFIVDDYNKENYASKIEYLLGNKTELNRMSENAIERINSKFSLYNYQERLLKFYKSLS